MTAAIGELTLAAGLICGQFDVLSLTVDVRMAGEVTPDAHKSVQAEGGCKKLQIFADVVYVWPITYQT